MYYENIQGIDNTREMISQWLGYNHNDVIGDGEFYDTKNLSCDRFPLMSPRKKRQVNVTIANDEWEKQPITLRMNYVGDITYAIGVYKYEAPVKENQQQRVSFNVDTKIVKYFNVSIKYLDREGKEISTEEFKEIIDNVITLEFVTPVNTTSIAFRMEATPKNLPDFKEEDLGKYVTEFGFYSLLDEVRGMLVKDSKLAYMIGTTLYYGNDKYDFEEYISEIDHTSKQQLLNYGAYILIFPLSLYLNTIDPTDMGKLSSEVKFANFKVEYQMSDVEGHSIDALISDTEPKNERKYDLWFDTKENKLKRFVGDETTEIACTVSETEPASPTPDMYWLCTKDNTYQLYRYIKYRNASADGSESSLYKFGKIDCVYLDHVPHKVNDGDYWMSTNPENPGLYIWVNTMSMWQAASTTYVSIRFKDYEGKLTDYFAEGDAVYMDTPYELLNEGSIIKTIGDDFIVVIGLIDEPKTVTGNLTIKRKLPEIDFACVSQNRVWACHTGDGVNEIYACKLGDPKNWFYYEGIASDSYALSISGDGVFTGCIAYNGYPYFFKENVVYEVIGNYPAAYQLYTFDVRGVQKGSHKSLAIVGEYLIYKSNRDVCIFDGTTPVKISDPLGYDLYSVASAGSSGTKYYISMHNDTTDEYQLFVYDVDKSLWMKEDNLKVEEFVYNNSGQLYGSVGLKVYGFEEALYDFAAQEAEKEEIVEWEGITGKMGYEYADHKYVTRLTMRADIPYRSYVELAISYDDGAFQILKTLQGDHKSTKTFGFTLRRCDHYQLRIRGNGEVKIYSLTRSFDTGSEEQE